MIHIKRIDEMLNDWERFVYETSTDVFIGFYETIEPSGIDEWSDEERDFFNWKQYYENVARKYAEKLIGYMTAYPDIIENCHYKRLNSPMSYNHRTDIIEIQCDVDVNALVERFGRDEGFVKYISGRYVGMTRFFKSVEDFYVKLEDRYSRDNCVDILIDYAILYAAGSTDRLSEELAECASEVDDEA